jgi:hypothetical protein
LPLPQFALRLLEQPNIFGVEAHARALRAETDIDKWKATLVHKPTHVIHCHAEITGRFSGSPEAR